MKILISMLTAFASFFSMSFISYAHNGGLDELGGHFRSADCVYTLHNPTSLAEEAENLHDLLSLIKRYNSSKCISNLNEDKVDLEGFTFKKTSVVNNLDTDNLKAPKPVSPNEKLELGKAYKATLEKCTDGDTAIFEVNGEVYKTRFLYIDTPESTKIIEPFGPEAAQFTCSYLKQGEIIIETDGGNLYDKYNRLLAWIWVDDHLLQEEITKAGLVEDFYDYGNYRYEDRIWAAMDMAKENGKGMYDPKVDHEKKNGNENRSDQVQPKDESSSIPTGKILMGVLVFLLFSFFFRLLTKTMK